MYKLRRSPLRAAALSAAAAAFSAAVLLAPASAFAQKTIKFIPEADLKSLDPVWTTAYITRNHGYMVYDTLFATDAKFQVHPQMVDKYETSKDRLTWTFTLRDGLKFHDGAPVRSADCIASIERWAKRDVLGQKLGEMTESWTAVNDKTFRLKLKKPFDYVLEALGKPSSNVPFILPERLAKTDAFTQVTDATGSGPFKMVKPEWVPGSKVVYVKNTDYVPRKEAPSWAAGGKVVKVDRVEWLYIPDSATAANAINAGEVDWWQQLPSDLVPLLAKNKDIKIENTDPLGSTGMIRFNHLQPPFNNQKMRQALLYVVNQQDYAIGIAGDAKNGKPCASYFTCGTPLASDAGSAVLSGSATSTRPRHWSRSPVTRARRSSCRPPINRSHPQALITTELLKKIG